MFSQSARSQSKNWSARNQNSLIFNVLSLTYDTNIFVYAQWCEQIITCTLTVTVNCGGTATKTFLHWNHLHPAEHGHLKKLTKGESSWSLSYPELRSRRKNKQTTTKMQQLCENVTQCVKNVFNTSVLKVQQPRYEQSQDQSSNEENYRDKQNDVMKTM